MIDREDNRQDLAVCWDTCFIEFQVPQRRLPCGLSQLERLCQQLTWPMNWSFRDVALVTYQGSGNSCWVLSFSVSGPPRAADGAYVRAKLNMIPENFSEHKEAVSG